MKLEETTKEGISYLSEVLNVTVENKSNAPQKINIFSNMEKKNENCKFSIYDEEKRYNYVTDMLKSNPMVFDKLRLHSAHLGQLQNHINLITNQLNGQSIKRVIYPLAHFSAYQFQSGIVDIEIQIKLDGKTELETQLIKQLNIALLNGRQQKPQFVKTTGDEVFGGEDSESRLMWFPISMNNTTAEDIEMNLNFNYENMNKYISSANLQNTPMDARLMTNVADGSKSFHDFILSLEQDQQYITFKSIHAIGDVKKLFASKFEYSVGNNIIPFVMNDTMNPAQFQTQMIEFSRNHPLNDDNGANTENIKFTIPANTKIIFFVTTNPIKK